MLNSMVGAFDSLLATLIPEPPAWYVDAVSFVDTLGTLLSGVTRWAPVGLLLTVGTGVLAIRIALWSVYGVRRLASYFTMGGGAIG